MRRRKNKRSNKLKLALILIVFLLLLVIIVVYISKNPTVIDKITNKADVPPVATPGGPPVTVESTVKLAAFNIQTFGTTKASKPEVMEVLSKTIRNFDIVAVQEIRDASQTVLPALRDAANKMGSSQYDFVVSERLGRTTSKEQYAYIYNKETIELIGAPYTYPEPSSNDMFQREPYVANFKAKNGNFDFMLITIHTDPDTAAQEINDLPAVVDYAKGRQQGEGDIIVMGDLNADCDYFDENSPSLLKSSDYYWVINNSIDTTTKATVCTYDRIILTSQATDFTGDSGVFRFDEAYNLTYDTTISVSDHYPVYATFWNNRDTD